MNWVILPKTPYDIDVRKGFEKGLKRTMPARGVILTRIWVTREEGD